MPESLAVFNDVEEHQYLTFMLGDEVFAISALSIKEIITYCNVTQVPSMNNYIDGITNVRGNVIPVVLLSHRFELPYRKATNRTCIIIVSVIYENEKCDVGLVVDKVDRVYDILPSHMEEIPTFGTKVRREFLHKMGKVDGRFISILDSNVILDIDELSRVRAHKNCKRRADD